MLGCSDGARGQCLPFILNDDDTELPRVVLLSLAEGVDQRQSRLVLFISHVPSLRLRLYLVLQRCRYRLLSSTRSPCGSNYVRRGRMPRFSLPDRVFLGGGEVHLRMWSLFLTCLGVWSALDIQ